MVTTDALPDSSHATSPTAASDWPPSSPAHYVSLPESVVPMDELSARIGRLKGVPNYKFMSGKRVDRLTVLLAPPKAMVSPRESSALRFYPTAAAQRRSAAAAAAAAAAAPVVSTSAASTMPPSPVQPPTRPVDYLTQMAPVSDPSSGLFSVVSPARAVRTAAEVVASSEAWRYQTLEAQRKNREAVRSLCTVCLVCGEALVSWLCWVAACCDERVCVCVCLALLHRSLCARTKQRKRNVRANWSVHMRACAGPVGGRFSRVSSTWFVLLFCGCAGCAAIPAITDQSTGEDERLQQLPGVNAGSTSGNCAREALFYS